ncbi:hypothetical protein M0804_015420 [Polistes exclamans]|nr:hypothetical protein M0804_015421 [Polistes exclamans]KAI4473282.1 hypothetical protein M0804_015420 [Polistes exclamans]
MKVNRVGGCDGGGGGGGSGNGDDDDGGDGGDGGRKTRSKCVKCRNDYDDENENENDVGGTKQSPSTTPVTFFQPPLQSAVVFAVSTSSLVPSALAVEKESMSSFLSSDIPPVPPQLSPTQSLPRCPPPPISPTHSLGFFSSFSFSF